MMQEEMEKITGVHVPFEEFEEIERLYMAAPQMTKQGAADLWKLRFGSTRSQECNDLAGILYARLYARTHEGHIEPMLERLRTSQSVMEYDPVTQQSYTILRKSDGDGMLVYITAVNGSATGWVCAQVRDGVPIPSGARTTPWHSEAGEVIL